MKLKIYLTTITFIFASSHVNADIYKYVDENGFVHFSDVKFKNQTSAYIKERPEAKKEQRLKAQRQRQYIRAYCKKRCSAIADAGISVNTKKCISSCISGNAPF